MVMMGSYAGIHTLKYAQGTESGQPNIQAADLKGCAVTVHRAGSLGTAPPSLITKSPHHPASASPDLLKCQVGCQ